MSEYAGDGMLLGRRVVVQHNKIFIYKYYPGTSSTSSTKVGRDVRNQISVFRLPDFFGEESGITHGDKVSVRDALDR